MSQQFKTAIDITARVSGVASVRELRAELGRLDAMAKVGLPLTGELGKLSASLSSLKGLASSISGVGKALGNLDNQAKGGFSNATSAISLLISRLGLLTSAARGAASALNSVASQQNAAWQSVNNSLATYISRANAARSASQALARPAVSPAASSAMPSSGVLGGIVSTAAVGAAAKATVGAGINVQGIQATLLAANNDNASAAAKDWDYLVKKADQYGVSLKEVGSEYARLKIAAMQAAKARGYSDAEGELAAKRQFEAISKVSTALHLQPSAVKGMIKAFEQMQSKGTVAAEELRNQLGDRLPATMALAAEAANTTVQKLDEMMRKKQLSSLEFATLLAEGISKKYETAAQKASKGMQAQFNRVQNAIQLSMNNLGSAGTFDVLADSAGRLADILNDKGVQEAIRGMGLAMAETAREIVGFVGAAKQFYTEHKAVIDTVAKGAIEIGKYIIALKLMSGAISLGRGSVAGLAKDFGLVGGAVGGMLRSLPLIGGFFDAVITKAGGAIKAIGMFRLALAGASAVGGYQLGKSWAEHDNDLTKASLVTAGQLKNLKTVEEADAKIAQLEKARQQRSDVASSANATLSMVGGGTSVAAEAAKVKAAVAKYDALLGVARAKKAELEKTSADAKDKLAKDEADLNKTLEKLKGKMVIPGEAKGGRGSKGSAAAGEASVGAAELQAAKALYAQRKTLLDNALKGELLSYADYAERMKNANELLYQSSLDAAEKQVATIKNPAARKSALAEKTAEIKAEFDKTNAEIEGQLAESNRKLLDAEDNLRAEYAAKVGETAQAGYARIEQKYKALRDELLRNGREDGVKLVDELIAVERADARMKQLQQTISNLDITKDTRLIGVDTAVSTGRMSGNRAEVEKLAIEKEFAAEQLKSLQLTMAEAEQAGMSERERLEYMKQALALKEKMNAVTDTQRRLEEQAANMLADSIASLADGSVKSWKDAAKQIRSIFNQLMTDMLRSQIKQAMASDKNGSGSLLGGILNSAVGGLLDLVGLGSGTSGGGVQSIDSSTMSSIGSSVAPSWSAPSLGEMFGSSSSSQSTFNTMNVTLNTQPDNPLNTSFLQQAADAQRRMGLMSR